MPDSTTRRPRLLITLGDPCGIGPELLLRSLHLLSAQADLVVVGSRIGVDLLESATERPVKWGWEPCTPDPALGFEATQSRLWTRSSGASGEALWIDPCPEATTSNLAIGKGSAVSGRCAVECVRLGASLVMSGRCDALVTLPLSKAAAHLAGYTIPGHTEFLQELAQSPITRMAFVSPSLSVVLHTVHQSLRSAITELSTDAVAETLSFSADQFMRLSGKLDLKIALCALNPHAGEGGAFGDEETILEDALIQAEASFMHFNGDTDDAPFAHLPSPFPPGPAPAGWKLFPHETSPVSGFGDRRDIEVVVQGSKRPTPPSHPAPQFFGPLPSDSVFQRAVRGEFDLVVALYHDQGLIPIKVLEPLRAVNLTLGLPFIRTSPDHGTAFDKAGHWQGDPTNFLEAANLAIRLAGRARSESWGESWG